MNANAREWGEEEGCGIGTSPADSRPFASIRGSLCQCWLLVARAAVGLVILSANAVRSAAAPPSELAQIPALQWQERSDWINVKTDIAPAAVGDGRADDTVAIQNALSGVRDGSVLYFPPGTYRITAPLVLKNRTGARWIGGLIVGSGRETKWAWDGADGGTMLVLNGMAYSRFIGLELDGRGKAAVGFHYQATQGFQTEVTHRHLAFRGFTNAAVLEDHPNEGQALAETTFENCLFERCERGVAFLQFNDYDYTFDGCEFRRCGVAIDCDHGNFYVRNYHFEASRVVDIRDGSEHCSSIRRSTSSGSQAFVLRSSSVAPLTIQDCHVEGWRNPEGAVLLSRPPVLLFDCVFTNPPRDGQSAGLPPVRVAGEGQRLLVSGNQVHGARGLIQGAHPMLITIPPGQRTGVIRSASQRFLKDQARLPGRVFDARRDFGARGNGIADDTAAIQKTIDAAAAASGGAIAYLPTGRYVISITLRITGKDFFVGGSGWCSSLIWKGPEGGIMVEVRDPQRVTLEDLMIGAHDAGAMSNSIDIHQLGSGNASHMTYEGVYVFGMYQKAPLRKGLRFTSLTEKDVVVLPHVQGNLRFVNCGRATVVANCSYEGSVVVEGKDQTRDGLLGFQTRLATIVSHGLYLRDNHGIVMSDFYVEQADNGYLFEGAADDPPGRATITGAKFHSFTSDDPEKNNLLDIRGYHGQIAVGPYQFYQEPKRMRMKQEGAAPVDLLVWASSWYGAKPDPQLGAAARLWAVGNEFYGTAPAADSATERRFSAEAPTEAALAKLGRALDDLRRLGEADLRLNHPEQAADAFAVFKSSDRGRSWTRSDHGIPERSRIHAFGSAGHRLFVGTDSAIFTSDDQALSWQHATGAATASGRVISFASLDGNVFGGTDGAGMLVSADGGRSWARDAAFPGRKVRCLLAHDGKVYVGTDAEGVLASHDAGRTWTRLAAGLPVRGRVFAWSAVKGKLFAGLYSRGLYAWDRQGPAWVKVPPGTPLALASVEGTLIAGHNPGGLAWSADLGVSWFKGAVGADAVGPSTVVASGDSGELSAEAPVWALASNDGMVFAGASAGIYHSEDRGRTWARARTGLPEESPGIAFLVERGFVLAGTWVRSANSPSAGPGDP